MVCSAFFCVMSVCFDPGSTGNAPNRDSNGCGAGRREGARARPSAQRAARSAHRASMSLHLPCPWILPHRSPGLEHTNKGCCCCCGCVGVARGGGGLKGWQVAGGTRAFEGARACSRGRGRGRGRGHAAPHRARRDDCHARSRVQVRRAVATGRALGVVLRRGRVEESSQPALKQQPHVFLEGSNCGYYS